MFACKNGGHRFFTVVYFIPQLTTNIMSVGQLDELDYNVHVKSVMMKICKMDGLLLARVP
jgi:hypothetical protein